VLRGGSWSYDDDGCRSGYRLLLQPAGCSSIIGFRMCVSSEAAG